MGVEHVTRLGFTPASIVWAMSTPRSATRTRRRDNQKCLNFENMLSDSDWVELKTCEIDDAVAAVLATRAQTLNVINPCEKTLYRMSCIVAFIRGWSRTNIDQVKVKRTRDTISEFIKQHRASPSLPYMTVYCVSIGVFAHLFEAPTYKRMC